METGSEARVSGSEGFVRRGRMEPAGLSSRSRALLGGGRDAEGETRLRFPFHFTARRRLGCVGTARTCDLKHRGQPDVAVVKARGGALVERELPHRARVRVKLAGVSRSDARGPPTLGLERQI